MIKCVNCNSFNLVIKFKENNYQIVNECYDCNEYNHIFIDDYTENYLKKNDKDKDKDKDKIIYFCNKHNQKFSSFCYTCNKCLCNECLLSHNTQLHNIENIYEMFTEEIKEKIFKYKNILECLESLMNGKISFLSQDSINNKDKISFYNTQLKIIYLKKIFLNINYSPGPDIEINLLNLISLKYLIDEFSEKKYKLLLHEISNNISYPNINILNNYHKNIIHSINLIPNEKIIQKDVNNIHVHYWVNHVTQLENGNIASLHWNYIVIYSIDKKNKILTELLKINTNNGSVNHLYEYKPNKLLACDNQMKIITLSEDNKSFKCKNMVEYGRKIIPYISYNKNENNKKILFIAHPNGIRIFSYDNNTIENDKEFQNEGNFSEKCDYSSIININDNQICGIYRKLNNPKFNFSLWEIDFENKKYNLLGEIENITDAIGRYSISEINEEYVMIARSLGFAIVSLKTIEVIQYINCDNVNSICLLNNGTVLTGGKNILNSGYYIRQWKYDTENNELYYIGGKKAHNDFINVISDIKDGFMLSCGRDGLINIYYN